MMDACSLLFYEKYLYHLHPKYSVIQDVFAVQQPDLSSKDPYISNDQTVCHNPLWMTPIPSGSSLLLPSFLPPSELQLRCHQCSIIKEEPSVSQHIQKWSRVRVPGK